MSRVVIKEKWQITLPAEVRKNLDLKIGDLFEVEVKNGNILLRPLAVIDKSQAWFWTKEWQEGEKRVDEELKKGHYKVFDHVEDLIKDLESEE